MAQIITLEQVKAQLGLTGDATYDDQIDAKLPIIDAKVKSITNRKFNAQYSGTANTTAKVVSSINSKLSTYPLGVNNPYVQDHGAELLAIGDEVFGDDMAAGTYITDVFLNEQAGFSAPLVYLSDAPTVDGSTDFVVGFNVGYHDIVAKGVWFLIQNTTASTAGMSAGVSSKRVGPATISFGEGLDKLDGLTGMPLWFVQGLGGLTVMRGH